MQAYCFYLGPEIIHMYSYRNVEGKGDLTKWKIVPLFVEAAPFSADFPGPAYTKNMKLELQEG